MCPPDNPLTLRHPPPFLVFVVRYSAKLFEVADTSGDGDGAGGDGELDYEEFEVRRGTDHLCDGRALLS